MQAFERFAKALCERFVCPFLAGNGSGRRGDGKVDTESIMTAEEVVERHFEVALTAATRGGVCFQYQEGLEGKGTR
ncbi:hypothetical protein FLP41_14290 [Paracoccus marcusii]|uniref:hypothetical protein n=1 Tax=Paracoccus marcusii TaxID=59779 RepID=UPI002ED1F4E4|nr:hypothetical protein FLP41_14290 [Paracoccus marcusii]